MIGLWWLLATLCIVGIEVVVTLIVVRCVNKRRERVASGEFDQAVRDIFAASNEPIPDTIVVDVRTAELHAQLEDAHERGDDVAMEHVQREAFRRLGL